MKITKKLKVYLAGPDIFRQDALEHAEWQKFICNKFNLDPLHPMDNNLEDANAKTIFWADVKQMKEADIILANISPFQGLHADTGTCFEIGYMFGLNKPIYLYSNDLRPIEQKRPKKDIDFPEFNNFFLPENLMITESSKRRIALTFTEACEMIKEDVKNGIIKG